MSSHSLPSAERTDREADSSIKQSHPPPPPPPVMALDSQTQWQCSYFPKGLSSWGKTRQGIMTGEEISFHFPLMLDSDRWRRRQDPLCYHYILDVDDGWHFPLHFFSWANHLMVSDPWGFTWLCS